ncbi:MAG: hypothetical protein V8Q30_00655 [Acutalibacteraceae bacterium]
MQSQGNIRVVEMLRYLYQHTDENHPATVTDITAYLKERHLTLMGKGAMEADLFGDGRSNHLYRWSWRWQTW